ncbi:MAG: PDDEXK nuclease domain-containing protein [Bacteroidales bacterium]|nr:PDDEXK nuclease domain-containing protein [Bacteroidales bacterium]
MIQKKEDTDLSNIQQAVNTIKTAILQSQARAAQAVNQEQLALYFGIGRYVSANTRNKNWGQSMLEQISEHLRQELPGLRGFSERHIKNMRTFYEAWVALEPNSAIAIAELGPKTAIKNADSSEQTDNEQNIIRQLRLTKLPNFPLVEFLGLSFTHHIRILESTKDLDERLYYIRYCHNYKTKTDSVKELIKKHAPYHHQDAMPNNFVATMPDYKQAYRAIQMFKDEYMLDFINVEELGMRDEDVDERVIEQSIVHNVKNFIMTFGKGFTFCGNQVHYDKLGHDHWVDLLFYNRDLQRLVVFELKNGPFKISYLAQLSAYLRILNDDDKRECEKEPVGIILCKSADKAYVEYVMQDFRQPMGVATYKTADEIDEEVLQVLPPKEQLQALLEQQERNRK